MEKIQKMGLKDCKSMSEYVDLQDKINALEIQFAKAVEDFEKKIDELEDDLRNILKDKDKYQRALEDIASEANRVL